MLSCSDFTLLMSKITLFNTCQYHLDRINSYSELLEEDAVKERPNSLAQIVGQAIFQRRRALGMSQEELAEKVGIGQQSLSRMEQGKTAPRFERLQNLADALDCRVVDLFAEPQESADFYVASLAELFSALSDEQRVFVHRQAAQLIHFLRDQEKN